MTGECHYERHRLTVKAGESNLTKQPSLSATLSLAELNFSSALLLRQGGGAKSKCSLCPHAVHVSVCMYVGREGGGQQE